MNTMITRMKRLLLTASFLALLATNILTLTNTAFNAALSGLLSTALGVQTVADIMNSKLETKNRTIRKQKATAAKQKVVAKRFGNRLVARTKRVAAASVAAIPAESLPILGISVLVAGTAYELYEACESIKDLDELYTGLGMDDAVPDDAVHIVCNPALPEPGQIWGKVVDKSDGWLDQSRAAM